MPVIVDTNLACSLILITGWGGVYDHLAAYPSDVCKNLSVYPLTALRIVYSLLKSDDFSLGELHSDDVPAGLQIGFRLYLFYVQN